jgi:hypothetical protein
LPRHGRGGTFLFLNILMHRSVEWYLNQWLGNSWTLVLETMDYAGWFNNWNAETVELMGRTTQIDHHPAIWNHHSAERSKSGPAKIYFSNDAACFKTDLKHQTMLILNLTCEASDCWPCSICIFLVSWKENKCSEAAQLANQT